MPSNFLPAYARPAPGKMERIEAKVGDFFVSMF